MKQPDIVLECRDISHWFGSKLVLHQVNLKIIRGEIVALVGPSGCGKSTLLRAIVGTHPPRQGQVLIHRVGAAAPELVTRPGRDRGIVYQHYSLFPFLTALENVALGLMFSQTSPAYRLFRYPHWRALRKTHLEEATALLERLRLGDAIHLYPHEMSGGMRQRVAIAQTLIMKPEVLLLDEPFGALDEATREELQRMLLGLYLENCQAVKRGEAPPYTFLIVTHELNEAIYVGDRVIGLSQYWDWKAEDHRACPGATIIYDQVAPVELPDQERNYQHFNKQREEIRLTAFDPNFIQPRERYVGFWESVEAGKGEGVLG